MGLAATLLHVLPDSRVLLVILLALILSTWLIRRQRNLPPGPWSYPFIGNLPDILDGRWPFCLKFMEYKYVDRNFNLVVYILNRTWMLLTCIMMKTWPLRSYQSIFGVEGSIHTDISAIQVGHFYPLTFQAKWVLSLSASVRLSVRLSVCLSVNFTLSAR